MKQGNLIANNTYNRFLNRQNTVPGNQPIRPPGFKPGFENNIAPNMGAGQGRGNAYGHILQGMRQARPARPRPNRGRRVGYQRAQATK